MDGVRLICRKVRHIKCGHEGLQVIAIFATKGTGTNEERRIIGLLSGFEDSSVMAFNKSAKLASFFAILRRVRREKPRLLVMEGTGLAGGLVCLIAASFWRVPYIFSSGDAVGPFIASHYPSIGWLFGFYERILCRFSAGFIGWSPYLVGRALTLGAPRGVTAPGWVHGCNGRRGNSRSGSVRFDQERLLKRRAEIRSNFGFSDHDIVFGLLGSLIWNRNKGYCYGLELLEAARLTRRQEVKILVVGDGDGMQELRKRAAKLPDGMVALPGNVPLDQVLDYLSAMDLASLPQSMDGVGLYRYTTKICEYLMAGLPIVSSRIPMAYDLDAGWCWRLPGKGPWTEMYVNALAHLMDVISWTELKARASTIPRENAVFSFDAQQKRVANFVAEILSETAS
jgi:glycosyltransferase involved in cell wall biosynthesis